MRKAKLKKDDLEGAAEHPSTKRSYKRWKRYADEVAIISNAQARFRCEGLFPTKEGQGNSRAGNFDGDTHLALAAFEKRNNLMGWGHFTADNLAALALNPAELVHRRLLRVLTARTVDAAGIVEDGSAGEWRQDFRWKDRAGEERALRNLSEEFSKVVIETLGVHDPAGAYRALERLKKLEGSGLEELLIAVKLPPLPEYYGPHMDLEAVIDRGDVWYDFPYDEEGNRITQRRRRYRNSLCT